QYSSQAATNPVQLSAASRLQAATATAVVSMAVPRRRRQNAAAAATTRQSRNQIRSDIEWVTGKSLPHHTRVAARCGVVCTAATAVIAPIRRHAIIVAVRCLQGADEWVEAGTGIDQAVQKQHDGRIGRSGNGQL